MFLQEAFTKLIPWEVNQLNFYKFALRDDSFVNNHESTHHLLNKQDILR